MLRLARGFTLIELLVVISIIGILATLVAANLNSARSRARDAERKSDLKNISTALRIYYNDNGRYPAQSSLPAWGAEWKAGETVYMQTLPIDPLSPAQDYKYTMGSASDPTDTDSFILSACLENASDTNATADNTCTSGVAFQLKP